MDEQTQEPSPFRLSNPRAGCQMDEQTPRSISNKAVSLPARRNTLKAPTRQEPSPFRLSNPRAGCPMDEQT